MTTIRGMLQNEDSVMSNAFFSDQNKQKLQNELRWRVYQATGQVIDHQDDIKLYLVMRSVYMEQSMFKLDAPSIRTEIARLNEIILSTLTPQVANAVIGYLKYLQNLENPITVMDNPIITHKDNQIPGRALW